MPRKATGRAYQDPPETGAWFVRFTLGDGKRRAFRLPHCPTTPDAEPIAERYRVRMAGWLALLVPVGQGSGDALEALLERAAQTDEAHLAAFDRAVQAIVDGAAKVGPTEVPRALVTFRDVGEAWTDGYLTTKYPDFVRAKKSVGDDRQRLGVLYESVGPVPVAAFAVEHYKQAMSELPATAKSAATRRQYAQLVHKVLALAVWPLEAIKVHPLPRGAMPKVRDTKAKGWLYPSEDARLLGCRGAPLGDRMLWGFLAREGCRTSEACSLQWRDLDLTTGGLTLDKNKTGDPRSWALDPGVARALEHWRRWCGNPRDDTLVFPGQFGKMRDVDHLAPRLREHLEMAGVVRAELFESGEHRIRLRAHDLRGTFVTLALALGRSETWVSDRTGHGSSVMIARYKRAARSAKERDLGWLVDLDQAIPEFCPTPGHADPGQGETAEGSERNGSDPGAARAETRQKQALSRSGGMADAADSKADLSAPPRTIPAENGSAPHATSRLGPGTADSLPIDPASLLGVLVGRWAAGDVAGARDAAAALTLALDALLLPCTPGPTE